MATEFAVQSKTFMGDDEPYDRLDDGSGWSHRRGRKYTRDEAFEEVKRISRQNPTARVVSREVCDWEEVE